MTTLSREDGPALWRQIEARLRGEIGHAYPPGARLPSEADLSRRFGVNRHTLRRAMDELARGGLVRVEHGRGAFVPEDVLDYVVEPRTRFSEWVRRHNKEPSGRVLRLGEEPADAATASALGVAEGMSVVVMERLGLADGRPVSLGTHCFAPRLHGMRDALASGKSVTTALRAVGVTDYVRRTTRVTARMPSAQEAELLRTARSRPLLVTENVNVDRKGAVVEFGVGRYPTPRVQIVFEP